MADEAKKPEAPAGGSKKLMRMIGTIGAVVLVAFVGGLAVYFFVLGPMIRGDAEAAPVDDNAIPVTAVEISFDTTFVNLIMPNEDMPTSTLLFTMTLSCAGPATADIITAHKARFSDLIIKLHDGRTRAEVVSDTRVLKESIQKQVVLESNRLLDRLNGVSTDEPIRVLDALHTQFAVSDNM